MTRVAELVDQLRGDQRCRVLPPQGHPHVRPSERAPSDLLEFFSLCGGATLFIDAAYAMHVVGPSAFVRANPAIVGAEQPDDISDTWYVVARGGSGEALTIDCHSGTRNGRCHDSFWDRHGVAGSCPIIACSFTELVEQLMRAQGRRWFWLEGAAGTYADAYDDAKRLL